jgi:hypothetical protein
MTGNEAYSDLEEQNDIGIYEIYGKYNQGKVAEALQAVGCPNPFVGVPGLNPVKFTGQDIIWNMDGKIASEGIGFQHDQYLGYHVSAGFSWFFMNLFARNKFSLSPKTVQDLTITPEEALKLDEVRRSMNRELGLEPATVSELGSSDFEFYVRAGNVWDYPYKCRRIDAGGRIGVLMPTGKTRNINNPASIPFGGNGKWGIYFSGDTEVELKEDWVVGALVRFNTRFKQTQLQRLPVAGEQPLYAASQGLVQIEPGYTFIFSPYGRLDCIRNGFGIQARFTMIIHNEDDWVDKRCLRSPAVELASSVKTSNWRAEYLTLNAFYDFAKDNPEKVAPILSFKWDMPLKLFLARGVAKTNRIVLGIQLLF